MLTCKLASNLIGLLQALWRSSMRLDENLHVRSWKRNPVLRGMDLPRQVGSVRIFNFFLNTFFHSVGKNDSPKITLKSPKNLRLFFKKKKRKLEKCFQLFSKIFSQFSLTLAKKYWFYTVLTNYKKKKRKNSQNGKSGSIGPVKQGFLFFMA